MKIVVLDASVVLKWYLPDESYGEKALSLLHGYITKELDVLSPSLLEYEVINGLMIAEKRGRVKEEKIFSAIEGFVDLGIRVVNLSRFYSRILKYCSVYKRSVYDASYLVLAEVEGISMITADDGLYNSIRKDLKWVKWLGDIG